ncbi:hypothetical protein N7539_001651 [Penicillium diatomitis]|uniref:Carboxymuconolactone decarboxylase-like domain-containing protein n=1 Tax=Penicillium diatomitis TaxID=2819901 RepID=A0A9W9XI18_9EURO|nr:uncharacterized protein N7539_001651 [Penicillium diatomitis]KAJ5492905.1 hypothetical protein N7539_001651 [Penicillium diatomitis]
MSTSESVAFDRAAVDPRWDKLFREIEMKFQKSNILQHKWYLTTLGAIIPSSQPEMTSQLYLYLLSQPMYSTQQERRALTLRFHEGIFKTLALLGVPKPAEAIISISTLEPEDNIDLPVSRESWQSGPENHTQGMEWLEKIYAQNTPGLLKLFRKHQDFANALCDISYGLYLSDRQILDDVDTELIALSAVMGQDLPRMTYWHMRGCRRVGISKDDVQMLCGCVHAVANLCGTELNRVREVQVLEEEV